MSLRRILVPLDGSAIAESALGFALMLPSTAVQLLTVLDGPKGGFTTASDAATYLSTIADRFTYRGIAIETTIDTGPPAAVIARQAANDHLVVMTSSGAGQATTGSVAHAVADHSPVPVILLRITPPDTTDPMVVRLVIPIDGISPFEHRAAVCGELAADLGLRVKIVAVPGEENDVEQVVRILRHHDVQSDIQMVADASPAALADIVRPHEIVVVEATGSGAASSSGLHALMDRCTGPVLIVPTG